MEQDLTFTCVNFSLSNRKSMFKFCREIEAFSSDLIPRQMLDAVRGISFERKRLSGSLEADL